MATPYEMCLEQNVNRERKVPEYVIERMYRQFDPPYWYEGWDDIQVVYSENSQYSRSSLDWLSSVDDFNQDSPYHSLTLGEHSEKVLEYIYQIIYGCDEHSISIRCAGALHDNGKCFCKTFTNSKGEITNHAHYYNHEHVGAYNSLFYKSFGNMLDVAVLIRWHMMPYVWERDNNNKLHNKYRKLWEERLYRDIMLIHRADKEAH